MKMSNQEYRHVAHVAHNLQPPPGSPALPPPLRLRRATRPKPLDVSMDDIGDGEEHLSRVYHTDPMLIQSYHASTRGDQLGLNDV